MSACEIKDGMDGIVVTLTMTRNIKKGQAWEMGMAGLERGKDSEFSVDTLSLNYVRAI